MKTTIDAVNEFKGVWPYGDNYPFMMQSPQGYYRSANIVSLGEFEILVCSRKEFDHLAKGNK